MGNEHKHWWRKEWRKNHCCVQCGLPVTNINKFTGRPFSRCRQHLLANAKAAVKYIRVKRKAISV